jgi:hypothetical protein
MRIIAAALLVVSTLLYTYWAFAETVAKSPSLLVEWVLVSAVGWFLFYDLWNAVVVPSGARRRRWRFGG